MAGFEFSLTANTKQFVAGVDDVVESLEEVQDSLKDVEKGGEKSLEQIEKSLKDVAEEAKRTGKEAEKDINKGFKDGTKGASEGVDDLKQNTKSNLKEVAASFDGTAEGIADGFQGLAAEIFEGFGPAGVAAGAAMAIGIGLATQAFADNADMSEEAKKRVREFGLAIIENGEQVAVFENTNEQLKLIVTNADDATKKYSDLTKWADKYYQTGIKSEQLAMAYAGNADAIELVNEQLQAAIKYEDELNPKTSVAVDQSKRRKDEYQKTADELKRIQEETTAAQAVEEAWLASGGAEIQAKADAISTINDAYDQVAGSVLSYLDEETGMLNVEEYLAAVEAKRKALEDYQNQLAQSNLSTEQKDALNAMGAEAAAAWMDAYTAATPKQKERMAQVLTEMASESSGEAKGAIDKAFEKPTEAKIEVKTDPTNIANTQNEIKNKLENTSIGLQLYVKTINGQPVN